MLSVTEPSTTPPLTLHFTTSVSLPSPRSLSSSQILASTMTITIEDLQCPSDTHQSYSITFFDEEIETMVTHSPSEVDSWISYILQTNQSVLKTLIIGLDIEWRPNFRSRQNNPAALLQLCVGRMCLIFQLLYAPEIPKSLIDFLNNPDFTFVGAGIKEDARKLLRDINVRVGKTVDIARIGRDKSMPKAGLKSLAREVLGKEVEKPKKVSMSLWDADWLTYDQIKYACIDAFLSFEIGTRLLEKKV